MRTLALLAALLLLALQAQAEPLPENKEEAPEQEQPGEEDQDMTISFAETEAPGLQRAGERPPGCSMEGRGRPAGGLENGSPGRGHRGASPMSIHMTLKRADLRARVCCSEEASTVSCPLMPSFTLAPLQ
uniref:Alpha-defensin N-terminal domain-containing protein n=1 Tax=Spermophilus dauricus TaxID=99837 RepID=A0A8C9UMR4_SPEDA